MVHRQELYKSLRSVSEVLERKKKAKYHMKRLCTKKYAPAKRQRIWRKKLHKLRSLTKFRCTPIEANVMSAPTSTKSEEREFVVDSGAAMNILSKKESSSGKMDTRKRSQTPTIVLTANGKVQGHGQAQKIVHDLNLFVTMQLLETPAVLSQSKL